MSAVKKMVCWLALGVLVGVFGGSGFFKLMDPAGFSLAVYRYRLLPDGLVNVAALWLAGLEVVCGAALLVPRGRRAALWVILGLLALFSLAIAFNLLRGLDISCGCFSRAATARPLSWYGVLKNMGFAALAVFLLREKKSP